MRLSASMRHGRLRIKVPAALADEFGAHLVIATPVQFTHRGEEWGDTGGGPTGGALRHQLRPRRGRWYLDASWTTSPEPVARPR